MYDVEHTLQLVGDGVRNGAPYTLGASGVRRVDPLPFTVESKMNLIYALLSVEPPFRLGFHGARKMTSPSE